MCGLVTMQSVGQYLASFAYDLIFFSSDVQTTTIAMAITGSLFFSILWAVVHLVTLAQDMPVTRRRSKGSIPKLIPYSQLNVVTSKSVNKQSNGVYNSRCRQPADKHLAHLSAGVQKKESHQKHVSVSTLVDLSYHQLDSVPQRLCFLGSQLRELNLSNNNLSNLPTDIVCLQGLTSLELASNKLTHIPVTLRTLHCLSFLDLQKNNLKHIPDSLWTLPSLKCLNVEENELTNLSDKIAHLSTLEELFLGYNQLTSLPQSVGCLLNLRILSVRDNPLNRLPDSIGGLLSLQVFNLAFCQLESLPGSIGGCVSLVSLDVGHNRLTKLPFEMAELQQLDELYLTDNNIVCLPATMENMKLHMLEVSGTPIFRSEFTDLPYTSISNTESFPSLLELAARSLSVHRVSKTHLLPPSLQKMLKEEQLCTCCRCPVFQIFQSRIRKGFIGRYSQVVPLWEVLCFQHIPNSAM
ncbi:plant intracellular Ras-group-related LRR protein 8-like [Gigantopelta aegis]|uniref:plant intracellular Ras-group-related LRR protein 8-like n=1 Tax=Gigantopelta aegis TaxID=1735272 RepID=UPI001B88C45B|nr:plant intracellular Ras-group-related LRR protein 8-like [Gigantopelta aegis]